MAAFGAWLGAASRCLERGVVARPARQPAPLCATAAAAPTPRAPAAARLQLRAAAVPVRSVRGRGGAGKPGGRGGQGRKREAEGQRLAKVLAEAGVASRRASEELIFEGRVKVNGSVELAPQTRVVRTKDTIEVDGKPIQQGHIKRWYFAVNKPKGYTCVTSEASQSEGWEQRQPAMDLFRDWQRTWKRTHPGLNLPRFQVAGNLDVNATGLLFVTNDGKWAAKVTSKSVGITREYTIATQSRPSNKQLEAIAAGGFVDEDETAFVKPVVAGMDGERGSGRLRVVVAEGSARQLRTLVESTGLRVNGVKRVRVGGYRMPRSLGFGSFVELKPHELRRITDRGADSTT